MCVQAIVSSSNSVGNIAQVLIIKNNKRVEGATFLFVGGYTSETIDTITWPGEGGIRTVAFLTILKYQR